MEITRETRNNLYTAYSKAFQDGFGSYASTWAMVATEVLSITEQNTYTWLGDFPGMREWIGDRQLKMIADHDYTIKNRKFEQTFGVPIDKIEDDQYGMYSNLFEGYGEAAAMWPDKLVWEAYRNGFTSNCYDGQFFFDTDHPKYDAEGKVVGSWSNLQAGGGRPWLLLNATRKLKPVIWQVRKKPTKLAKLDRDEDPNVFWKDQFVYGNKARGNSGYAFPQMAFASKTALTEANFKAARTAMTTLTDERGEPIVNEPNLLVVNTADRDAAEALILKEKLAGGEDNTLRNAVKILVTPHLY
jgi:phage major head subunit gpT-like protein